MEAASRPAPLVIAAPAAQANYKPPRASLFLELEKLRGSLDDNLEEERRRAPPAPAAPLLSHGGGRRRVSIANAKMKLAPKSAPGGLVAEPPSPGLSPAVMRRMSSCGARQASGSSAALTAM